MCLAVIKIGRFGNPAFCNNSGVCITAIIESDVSEPLKIESTCFSKSITIPDAPLSSAPFSFFGSRSSLSWRTCATFSSSGTSRAALFKGFEFFRRKC